MIKIENIIKEYNTKDKSKIRVLNNINLTIKDGEMIALLGANGSGKSTLLKCICGVLRLTSGSIRVDGKDAFKNRKYLIKNMGVIFNQKPSFIIDLSVRDNLNFFQAIYEIPQEKFDANIDFIDQYLKFKDLLEKPYRKLSFGERVKCEIVSILLHDPQYIYMDEPTIGLDYNAKKGLYELIAELKKQGRTIIIITHEVDYIEGVCDKVVILKNGVITYEGNPKKVTDRVNEKQRIVVKYNSVINNDNVKNIQLRSSVIKDEEREIQFVVQKNEDIGRLIANIASAYDIESLNMERISIREVLEDAIKEDI
ncbi:MAG: ATP-binding cassette domain-containing protein [Lachnospiraceae bacterium]|nr:ATP-binding cassette domain-containing protein [Lachnospiraceae bacterium]MEE0960525.1 ATP-binding cassette domain-containing protein [Lachnospiraceae bacterium]